MCVPLFVPFVHLPRDAAVLFWLFLVQPLPLTEQTLPIPLSLIDLRPHTAYLLDQIINLCVNGLKSLLLFRYLVGHAPFQQLFSTFVQLVLTNTASILLDLNGPIKLDNAFV